jgi:CheY-like chemotaxis protein
MQVKGADSYIPGGISLVLVSGPTTVGSLANEIAGSLTGAGTVGVTQARKAAKRQTMRIAGFIPGLDGVGRPTLPLFPLPGGLGVTVGPDPFHVNNSGLRCPTEPGHTRPAMPYRQRILLGNCEPSLTAFLQALLGRKSPHAEFTVASTVNQVLQHATRTQFDAAIIVIDNLAVPTNAPAERIDAVLDALSQLQVRGAMPVTALSVYCPNSEFIQRVRDAGADAFLLLPAEPYAIQGAVTAAFDNFVRRESSGLAPVHRLAAVLVDLGYADVELKMSESRNSIDFRVRRKPEDLGRYLKQHDREYSRMLGAIRAAGFVRVGFEELALEVRDDVVEGSFLVRPLHEVCEDSAEPADDDEEWLD